MKLNKKSSPEMDFWQGTMSDIAFLLIIFFILTALYSVTYVLRFTSGSTAAWAIDKKDLITLEIAEDGSWLMENQRVKKSQMPEFLRRNKKYRIRVDDNRSYQDFIDLLDVFYAARIDEIEIVTKK